MKLLPTLLLSCAAASLPLCAGSSAPAAAPGEQCPAAGSHFHALPQFVRISGIEVSTDSASPRVSATLSNSSEQDIRISIYSEAGWEQVEMPHFSIGDDRFLLYGEPDRLSIPAGGTAKLNFRLCAGLDRYYDPESDCYDAHRDTVDIALRKGGAIRFRYPVQSWSQGDEHHSNENGDIIYLCGEAPSPKADAQPPRLRMPEGPYQVGAAALADIRSIYDAAAYRRWFNLSEAGLRPFADYLKSGKPTVELLHLACDYNCPDLAAELIARGVDVRALLHDPDSGQPLSPLHRAALPCYHKGSVNSAKARRLIDLLLEAGADPAACQSTLAEVAGFSSAHQHMESVFCYLYEGQLPTDEEHFTPEQREEVLDALRYRRELGQPWRRAEQALGVRIPPTHFPEPTPDASEPESDGLDTYEALAAEENDALRQALAAATRVRLVGILPTSAQARKHLRRGEDISELLQSIELKPAEAARLLAPLRRVPQWYRLVSEDDEAPITLFGLQFCDAEGRNLTAFCDELTELYYSAGDRAIKLASLMERYLPWEHADLPSAQQIRVLDDGSSQIFVIEGETALSLDEVRQKAEPGKAYALVFGRKQIPDQAQALRDTLGKSIRINGMYLPSSFPPPLHLSDAPDPADFPLEPGEEPAAYSSEGDFCYVPLPPDENTRLRDALARCATLQLEGWSDSIPDIRHQFKLSNENIAELLNELAATPQWYDTRQNLNWDIDPAYSFTLRLLDADGNELWLGTAEDTCRRHPDDAEFQNLLELLERHLPFTL